MIFSDGATRRGATVRAVGIAQVRPMRRRCIDGSGRQVALTAPS